MNVLIIILLLLPNCLFTSERIYVGDISKHPFTLSPHTLSIELLDKNQYLIVNTDNTYDIITDYHISMGNYTIKNDTIIFKDIMFDYKFKGTITNEIILNNVRLNIISGIDYLEGRGFDYQEVYIWSPKESLKHIKSLKKQTKLRREWIDSLKRRPFETSISLGVYTVLIKNSKTWNDIRKFKLEINENHKYRLYINADYILFSEGEWVQKNQLLVLKDGNTNAKFKLEIIDKNQLKTILIPATHGLFHSYILRLNQNKE